MKLVAGVVVGLVLGGTLTAVAQSEVWVSTTSWRRGGDHFDRAVHLGYVAGALDTVSDIAVFNAHSDAQGLGHADTAAMAKAIQQCAARAHLRNLGDYVDFAERTMTQYGGARASASDTILKALYDCGK
jgi:hypothetical protein